MEMVLIHWTVVILKASQAMEVNKISAWKTKQMIVMNFFRCSFKIIGWNSQDDRTLVVNVKTATKANDKVSYTARLKQFDWNKIAFQNYSAKECENRFNTLMKQVRRQRNLNEIAVDIEAYVTKVKKPLNAYQLFMKEQLSKVTTSGEFVSWFVFT